MSTKRILFLLLLIALLLPLSGQAEAAPTFTPGADVLARFNPPPRDIQSLAAYQGGLYFSSYASLYALLPGGAAHTIPLDELLGRPAFNSYRSAMLVRGEDAIAVLDTQSGLLVFLDVAGDAIRAGRRLQLDWADYITQREGYTQVEPPTDYALAGDRLYALAGPGAPLTRFDLADGSRLPPLHTAALRIAPYKEGQLLLIAAQQQEGQGKAQLAIARCNPADDSATIIQALAEAPGALGHISYDREGDCLLVAQGDSVYSYQGLAAGQPCAQLPINDGYQERLPLAALPGGLLAVSARQELYIKAADPQAFANKTRLSLLVATDNPEGLNRAMSAADDIALTVRQQSLSPLELAQMLITGDEGMDMYWLNLSGVDFASLMRKGYALDLSGSPALNAQHDRLYPFVKPAVGSGEGIYALPMSAYVTVLLGDKDLLFDSALRPRLHTLNDLMDYLAAWPADEQANRLPFMGHEARAFAYRLALQVYADSAMAAGQPLSFDTPLMRQLFTRLDGMAFAHGGADGQEESYQMPAIFSNEWLMSLRQFGGDGRDGHTFFPFLLSAGEGQPAALPMEVSCVFINARTKEPEAAISFLEALARVIPDDDRIMLRASDNQPVENPHYPQVIAEYQALLARQREKLKQAEGAEKTELAAWLARAEDNYQALKTSQRYTISADNIAAYRLLARHAFVRQFDGQHQGLQAALDILPQYVDGSMDLERFIADIESRLKLIRAEHQ